MLGSYTEGINSKLLSQKVDVVKTSGPGFMTKSFFNIICNSIDLGNDVIFPMHYFYPISN